MTAFDERSRLAAESARQACEAAWSMGEDAPDGMNMLHMQFHSGTLAVVEVALVERLLKAAESAKAHVDWDGEVQPGSIADRLTREWEKASPRPRPPVSPEAMPNERQ